MICREKTGDVGKKRYFFSWMLQGLGSQNWSGFLLSGVDPTLLGGWTQEIEQLYEAVENSERSNRENGDIPALNPLVEVNRKPSTD